MSRPRILASRVPPVTPVLREKRNDVGITDELQGGPSTAYGTDPKRKGACHNSRG